MSTTTTASTAGSLLEKTYTAPDGATHAFTFREDG